MPWYAIPIPVPLGDVVLVELAVVAVAYVVAVLVERMIAAEVVAAEVEAANERVGRARRDVLHIHSALGGIRRGLASDCACGYVGHVDRARGRLAQVARDLEG